MADMLSEQNPIDAWSKLIENTMKQYSNGANPTPPVDTQSVNGVEDPWLTLINRLWQANPYNKLFPLDPAAIMSVFQKIWLDALQNPMRYWESYSNFMQQYSQIMTSATLKFWGFGQNTHPVAEPEKGDKRFSAPDWQYKSRLRCAQTDVLTHCNDVAQKRISDTGTE